MHSKTKNLHYVICLFLFSTPFIVLAEVMDLPRVGLSIEPPVGFERATRFDGLVNPQTKDTILIMVLPEGLPGNYLDAFTKEALATRGINEESREQITLDTTNAILVRATQTVQGYTYGKWILLFEHSDKTYMVNASYRDRDSEIVGKIKAALTSIKFVDNQSAELSDIDDFPFTVEDADGLIREPSRMKLGQMIKFSESGDGSKVEADEPLLIVAGSLGEGRVREKETFAKSLLKGTSQVTKIKISLVDELKINSLPAVEITAKARDIQTNTRLKLYQLLVFMPDGSYVRAVGLVGKSRAKKFLPIFKKIARSIKAREQFNLSSNTTRPSALSALQSQLQYGNMNYEQLTKLIGRKPESSRYLQKKAVRHQWRDDSDMQLSVWLRGDSVVSSSLSTKNKEANKYGCYIGKGLEKDFSLALKILLSENGHSFYSSQKVKKKAKISTSTSTSWRGNFLSTDSELTLMSDNFAKNDNITFRWIGDDSLKYQSIVLTKADEHACRQPDVANLFSRTND